MKLYIQLGRTKILRCVKLYIRLERGTERAVRHRCRALPGTAPRNRERLSTALLGSMVITNSARWLFLRCYDWRVSMTGNLMSTMD
jgi:hypothetical protein